MAEAKLSSKNQIVIPREAREALQIRAGDRILIISKADRVLVLCKPKSHSTAIRGLAENPYPKRHLQKERQSWE